MTPEQARAWFLPIHGTVGVLALVGGVAALLTRKGSPAHRWAGRTFALSMLLAIVAASPVLVATRNPFLTGMGSFAGYMTWMGFRLARLKDGDGTAFDRGVAAGAIAAGLGFSVWGAFALARGNLVGLVPVAMGLLFAGFGREHTRYLRAPRAERGPWVAAHLGAAGGGLIAGTTAFAAATLTNFVPSVPEPIVWLAPAAVLGPILRRASQRARGAQRAA